MRPAGLEFTEECPIGCGTPIESLSHKIPIERVVRTVPSRRTVDGRVGANVLKIAESTADLIPCRHVIQGQTMSQFMSKGNGVGRISQEYVLAIQ